MPDVAMWGRALRVMPRLDKQQWAQLDLVSRWLVATRSAVLVMTFTSAAFAGLLAAKAGQFDLGLWLLVTLGLLLAHATNNLVNDLTDSWKGVDKDNYFRNQYGPQPLEAGLMSVRELLAYIAVTGLAALAIGAWLVAARGAGVAWLLAAGAVFVLFYTFPLKYIGLGEPAVLVVWGPLMVGGGYYVITGAVEHARRDRERRLRARPDGGAVRQAHRQAGRGPRQEDPHAAGDPRRSGLALDRARHAGGAARAARRPRLYRLLPPRRAGGPRRRARRCGASTPC